MKPLVLFLLTAAANASTIVLDPVGGSIFGPAGSTLGWGYTITNDTSNFLQPLSLNAGIFAKSTPSDIFDFPTVAPNASVTLAFSPVATGSCGTPPCGLYDLTWDPAAVPGFSVNGVFTISSEFFDAPPDSGGNDLGPAPDLSAPYKATVSSVAAPEPSSESLLLMGVALVCAHRLRRWPRQLLYSRFSDKREEHFHA